VTVCLGKAGDGDPIFTTQITFVNVNEHGEKVIIGT